jgi:hypothetical protein
MPRKSIASGALGESGLGFVCVFLEYRAGSWWTFGSACLGVVFEDPVTKSQTRFQRYPKSQILGG